MPKILPYAVGGYMAVFCIFLIKSADAQCPGGNNYQTIVSATTLVGSGNNTYRLPLFDPSIGTLYSVDMLTKLYSYYSYTLTNINAGPQNTKIIVNRIDTLYATSPVNTTPIIILDENNASYPKTVQINGVAPGSTNYKTTINNGKLITTPIDQDLVPFMGSDSLYLTYISTTEAGSLGSSDIQISNQLSTDSIIFTLTYNYCPTAPLALAQIHLSSSKQSSNLMLSWVSDDVLTEGWYELLKSTDARTYTSINRQPINKSNLHGYSYLYPVTKGDGTKGFFRIKQTDKAGNVTYSKILTAALPPASNIAPARSATSLSVYPTVTSKYVNISLPEGNSNDEWQIRILSISGQVLQQNLIKGNTSTLVNLPLAGSLPSGMHIVNAVNKRTNLNYQGKIIVQH